MNATNHPSHYSEGRQFEPIDVISDWGLDFDLGNIVKYVSRAGRKEGSDEVEDLRKAMVYLEHAIAVREGRKPTAPTAPRTSSPPYAISSISYPYDPDSPTTISGRANTSTDGCAPVGLREAPASQTDGEE